MMSEAKLEDERMNQANNKIKANIHLTKLDETSCWSLHNLKLQQIEQTSNVFESTSCCS
jgi:hypothetical protein